MIETGNPLVFDLSLATFADSSVVNAVIRARSELAKRGVPVALVVPDSGARLVSRLIELANIDKDILIVRSHDEANSSSSPRPGD